MKVLVTGAGGQLGLDLLDALAHHEVVGLTHAHLDVAVEADVVAAIDEHRPDLVVHAAAWTDVDGCEGDPARAHRVNALGSWWVARACRLVGAAMVYVSTDYVFDGRGTRPYTEFQPVDPINEYGRSKAAGEQLVRRTLDEHYVVRTAWVCGARGHNFVRTMLDLARQRDELRVVGDQIGCPTFTRDLAAAIVELAVTGRFGTYHRTNRGTCSWYDLAAATFELAGLDVRLDRTTSEEFARPAPRPAYSVLSDLHATTSGLRRLPEWRDGLHRLLDEMGELA